MNLNNYYSVNPYYTGNSDWIKQFEEIFNCFIKQREKTPMEKLNIKQVIYNKPATIIQWNDDTKTIVKATKNDTYDPVFGFLMAYFQKNSGMTKTQVAKFIKNVEKECAEQQLKKDKKKEKKAE